MCWYYKYKPPATSHNWFLILIFPSVENIYTKTQYGMVRSKLKVLPILWVLKKNNLILWDSWFCMNVLYKLCISYRLPLQYIIWVNALTLFGHTTAGGEIASPKENEETTCTTMYLNVLLHDSISVFSFYLFPHLMTLDFGNLNVTADKKTRTCTPI